jgi:hypothetical protein
MYIIIVLYTQISYNYGQQALILSGPSHRSMSPGLECCYLHAFKSKPNVQGSKSLEFQRFFMISVAVHDSYIFMPPKLSIFFIPFHSMANNGYALVNFHIDLSVSWWLMMLHAENSPWISALIASTRLQEDGALVAGQRDPRWMLVEWSFCWSMDVALEIPNTLWEVCLFL